MRACRNVIVTRCRDVTAVKSSSNTVDNSKINNRDNTDKALSRKETLLKNIKIIMISMSIRYFSNTSVFSLFLKCVCFIRSISSVEQESLIFSLSILLLDCFSYMYSRENVTLTLNVIYSK